MLSRFFNSQTKSISTAAGILFLSGLISRVLGLIRNWLLSATFGASPELDVYFAAFRIPDLVYNVLIAGGIIVAFLPLFSEYFSKNKDKAWEFCNNTLNIFLFLLILISLIFFIFTPQLIKLIAPGFDLEQVNLCIILTRLMFLSPILLGLSSIFSGVLQYFNRFFVYGLCPILYNLGIILGILFLAPTFGVLGVAIGVILGAILHLLIQIPSAVGCGFKYKPIFNFRESSIKRVFFLMIPRTIAVASQQINLIVITAIASTLAAGSIVIFNFANDLQYVPIGMIGVSFAVAAFPKFARTWAEFKKSEFIESFSSTFRQILYLILPISVLMFILREQIVGVILKHGQFGPQEARLTSVCLGFFCFGIFAASLSPLISRAFFAFQNTKTPTAIAVISTVLNIILSFSLVNFLKAPNFFQNFLKDAFFLQEIEDISVTGLPLAFSIAGIFQFILLMIFLRKSIGGFLKNEIWLSLFKIILGSLFMAGIMDLTLHFISPIFPGLTFWGAVFQLLITGFIGILVYFLSTFLLGSREIETVKNSVLKRFRKN